MYCSTSLQLIRSRNGGVCVLGKNRRTRSKARTYAATALFRGQALIWFRANRRHLKNWILLAKQLNYLFPPADYDLFEEIKRRTQGKKQQL